VPAAAHRHTHGVAVHGRVVERRHDDAARLRARQRAAGGGDGVDLLDLRHRAGGGEEFLQGFVEGEQAHFRLQMPR
jgi:hypothetical protein